MQRLFPGRQKNVEKGLPKDIGGRKGIEEGRRGTWRSVTGLTKRSAKRIQVGKEKRMKAAYMLILLWSGAHGTMETLHKGLKGGESVNNGTEETARKERKSEGKRLEQRG